MPRILSAARRPRRSFLYVPASNIRAIDKARKLPCDGVILDLEDGVAPEAKNEARTATVAALGEGGFGNREVIVRVNALDTEWGPADIAAVSRSTADAVLVPKIRSGRDILEYNGALSGAAAPMQLWAMIETAMCMFKVEEIAGTARVSRLTGLVMGTNDLARELRMQFDPLRAPIAAMLTLTVAAARAYELAVLDGVYNAFEDEDGFEAQCRQGVEYGFDGKTLIHPRQIDACNSIFAPSAKEVEWARRVKSAFEKPENVLKGALRLDGVMVERLHLEQAERILMMDAGIRDRQT